MRFAFSSGIFRRRALAEAIQCIAKARFTGLELVADRPHAFPPEVNAARIAQINEALAQYKMKICSVNSCVVTALGDGHRPSWLEEDWKERESRVRYTLECVRMAAALGVNQVIIQPGGGIPETMNHFEAWRLFVANMHRMSPLAKRLGVKLLIQPGPDLIIESTAQMLAFLEELEFEEHLGVNFDAGHFFRIGEDPLEAWEKLQPHARHVHLEDVGENRDRREVRLGEGVMELDGFLRGLERSGYEGYVTIKLDSYEQMAGEMVAGSADYLTRHGFLPGAGDSVGEQGLGR